MGIALECPVCGNQGFKSLFALKGADVVACRKCKVVYVPSPLPEVTSLYKADYFGAADEGASGYLDYAGELEAHTSMFTERLQTSEMKIGGRGRVLDVGCALGHFGKVAKDRGWDVFVTDISEYAVVKSAKEFQLQGFVSPTGKLPVKDKKFDLVTLFDVIEHLSHPYEILNAIHRSLDPRGILHLSTPNIKSFSARILGKHWYHLKPEEHLIYFSPATIKLCLEKANFEVLEIKPMKIHMALGDILMRLRRYSKPICDLMLKFVKLMKWDRKVIKLLTGEIEVWARPKPIGVELAKSRKAFPVDNEPTPILGVVCCPNCRGELYPENQHLNCLGCDSAFDIEFGVINFSKYAKQQRRKTADE